MDTTASLLGDAPELDTIVAFLRGKGLDVVSARALGDTVVPGMTVSAGCLSYDDTQPGWVGDLLHEAGHIAVTDPATRHEIAAIGDDPAEEMAAIAWSYAAAMAIGLPVETLFHAGYKGGPDYLIQAFADGAYIGLPMLQYWGMATRPGENGPVFPAMRAWLRSR